MKRAVRLLKKGPVLGSGTGDVRDTSFAWGEAQRDVVGRPDLLLMEFRRGCCW